MSAPSVSEAVAALLSALGTPDASSDPAAGPDSDALSTLYARLGKMPGLGADVGLATRSTTLSDSAASSRASPHSRGPSPSVDAKALTRVEVDVAGAGVKAIAEYPLLKQGEDFGAWLAGFQAKAASVSLADEQKLDLLALRLDNLGGSFLRMCRAGKTFAEACRVLAARMSPKSDVALRDGADLSVIRQEDSEPAFTFYLRLCEAYGRASASVSDEEFRALLSAKLNTATKDYVRTLSPKTLDDLIHILKVYDQQQLARPAVVNLTRLRCYACGGIGHRATECPKQELDAPYDQPARGSWRGGRGRRRGRGRAHPRGRGYARGSFRGASSRGYGRGSRSSDQVTLSPDSGRRGRKNKRGRSMVATIHQLDAATSALISSPAPSSSSSSSTSLP